MQVLTPLASCSAHDFHCGNFHMMAASFSHFVFPTVEPRHCFLNTRVRRAASRLAHCTSSPPDTRMSFFKLICQLDLTTGEVETVKDMSHCRNTYIHMFHLALSVNLLTGVAFVFISLYKLWRSSPLIQSLWPCFLSVWPHLFMIHELGKGAVQRWNEIQSASYTHQELKK